MSSPLLGVKAALIQEATLFISTENSSKDIGKFRLLPNPHLTHNGMHTYLDRRQTHCVLVVRPLHPVEPNRTLSYSVQVNDSPVLQTQRLPPGVEAAGPVWNFNLDPNHAVTQRISILCSSMVGRGLQGGGTVEDRELRWFHVDYWP